MLLPIAVLAAGANLSYAQATREWHRDFSTSIAEPVSVEIKLTQADLQIAYAREGEVSIKVSARHASGADIDENYFAAHVLIEQSGNKMLIREQPGASAFDHSIRMAFQIDVPYRTQVQTRVATGMQSITGVMGPVTATSDNGDIHVSYVSNEVTAETGTGNLDLQVVGAKIEARAGTGNISCSRSPQGIDAETTDGDITLMVVGSSRAIIKTGTGRIEVGGVRGTLLASTIAGDLHVKAVPHDDWQLKSVSGNIRVELPPQSGFEVHAETQSGALIISRDDLEKPNTEARRCEQKANGGGKRIELHTGAGKIVIS
jgi:DUF4097 and DUF4098 domain-containing protein YvlB